MSDAAMRLLALAFLKGYFSHQWVSYELDQGDAPLHLKKFLDKEYNYGATQEWLDHIVQEFEDGLQSQS